MLLRPKDARCFLVKQIDMKNIWYMKTLKRYSQDRKMM
jgi:hypothetical protein